MSYISHFREIRIPTIPPPLCNITLYAIILLHLGGANKGRARPGGHVLNNTKLRITGTFSYITASYFSYSTSTASVAIT